MYNYIIEFNDDALLEEIQLIVGLNQSDCWDALSSEAKNEISESLKEIG